jgi:hypothetical protein
MEPDPKTKPPEDDASPAGQAISESKMRQALGIEQRSGERHVPAAHNAGAPRRRFVADGDVPVVMIGRRRDHAPGERGDQSAALSERLAALEVQVATERDARSRAESLLAEARQTIQHLQTQIAHAELTREEAVGNARRAIADRSDALRDLQDAQRELHAAQRELQDAQREVCDVQRALHDAQRALHDAPRALHDAPRALHDAPRALHDAQRAPPPAAPLPLALAPPIPLAARAARSTPPLPANPGCDVPAFTAQILSAYLARNKLSPTELPGLAESVMHALVAAVPPGGK